MTKASPFKWYGNKKARKSTTLDGVLIEPRRETLDTHAWVQAVNRLVVDAREEKNKCDLIAHGGHGAVERDNKEMRSDFITDTKDEELYIKHQQLLSCLGNGVLPDEDKSADPPLGTQLASLVCVSCCMGLCVL